MNDILSRLTAAGILNVKLEGQGSSNPQYAFPCPFHANSGRRLSARYSVHKHLFYCFGGCVFGHDSAGRPRHGLSGREFWKKLGVRDTGFAETAVHVTETSYIPFNEFLVPEQETLEMGERLFDACEPISKYPAAVDYLTRRLGEVGRLPMDCRYHAESESLMFWSGKNYVQKYLTGKGRTFGDAHLFTHHTATDTLVLVEGPFDYLAVHYAGFPAAAALGLSITPLKLRDLREMGVTTLYLAFDNDLAGQRASLQLKPAGDYYDCTFGPALRTLESENLRLFFVPMAAGKKDFGETPYYQIRAQLDLAINIADVRMHQLEALCAWNPF